MRRTRPKGDPDPGWQRIGWDEAMDETARRLGSISKEFGAEAVAFAVTTPSGTSVSDAFVWIERFARVFGSPNIWSSTEVCNWHRDTAHAFTFGCGMPPADYAHAELVLLWGHNPTNTWLAQAHSIGVGRRAGARMIVVDPRPTTLAREADVWLRVRPGTDTALALGLIRLLIEEDKFDHAFVREWTNAPCLVRQDTGALLRERDLSRDAVSNRCVVWDERSGAPAPWGLEAAAREQDAEHFRLRESVDVDVGTARITCTPVFALLERACAPFVPQVVRQVTGVDEEALRAAAALLGATRRVAYHSWTGIGQHTNATQAERATAILYALCGGFDRVGGNRIRQGPPSAKVNALSLLPATQLSKALGANDRPIGPPSHGLVRGHDVYRAILSGSPYRIRAMMAFGTNAPISQADTALAAQALAALDFHVHCDVFETPAASYADILLPINTPWEREGLRIGFNVSDKGAGLVQLRQRMVSARHESRSDNDVVFDLAVRLGMGDSFFAGSLDAGWDHMLAPMGLNVAQLRSNPAGVNMPADVTERKFAKLVAAKAKGFSTPSGLVELYSELLLAHGQSPLAQYLPPAELSEEGLSEKYPYILTSAKNGLYCHSQHRSITSLRRRSPDPVAELSPMLAKAKGVEEGDWVVVVTRKGRARFVARIENGLADDVIVAEFGWWQACEPLDREGFAVNGPSSSNFNVLIDSSQCDPVSGSVAFRSSRCDLERDGNVEPRQRKWLGDRRFRVHSVTEEADGVRRIDLSPLEGAGLPDYHPGQHIEIAVTLTDGVRARRAYSLIGKAKDADRRSYSIAVRLQQHKTREGLAFDGLVSGHIHRTVCAGHVVDVRAPSGTFTLPRRTRQPTVFFAAGIGITPFMSFLESMPNPTPGEAPLPDIRLYYANRSGATCAFKDRIMFHQKRLPNLRVINHYSAPRAHDVLGRDFESNDVLTADAVPEELIAARALFYLCGPQQMTDAITQGLIERRVPRFDIFSEVFRSPCAIPAGDDQSFAVTYQRSERLLENWTPSKGSLLTFGESLGLSLPSGCRVGQCESCATRLLSGTVRHLHGREPEDPQICLPCQAIPTSNLVLDA